MRWTGAPFDDGPAELPRHVVTGRDAVRPQPMRVWLVRQGAGPCRWSPCRSPPGFDTVLGWHDREFTALAETLTQLNPAGWVVFGGDHVSGQGDRVLTANPEVDVGVNGEGEFTFRGGTAAPLSTMDQPRVGDPAVIPSPFRTGAIPMTDAGARV